MLIFNLKLQQQKTLVQDHMVIKDKTENRRTGKTGRKNTDAVKQVCLQLSSLPLRSDLILGELLTSLSLSFLISKVGTIFNFQGS